MNSSLKLVDLVSDILYHSPHILWHVVCCLVCTDARRGMERLEKLMSSMDPSTADDDIVENMHEPESPVSPDYNGGYRDRRDSAY